MNNLVISLQDSVLYVSDPLPVHGLVSLAGIPDLAEAIKIKSCGDESIALMGGLPEEHPERYKEGVSLSTRRTI